MRHVATGLLFAALALYVPARMYESVYPLAGYLRAFAEAAMVGALADWFAVTALFRRPLGLPIPHTAVIQRNKDRIGAALGRFVEAHFLTPAAIGAKLGAIDFAALVAQWLEEPRNRTQVAEHLSGMLPRVLDAVKDEEVGQLAREQVRGYLSRHLQIAPLMAEVLEMLVAENRHQRFIDELLAQARGAFHEGEPLIRALIRERVSARVSWLQRRFGMEDELTEQLVAAAEEALVELGTDPARPWRWSFDRSVRDLIETLRTSSAYHDKGEALKAHLLDNRLVAEGLDGLWDEIKRSVHDDTLRSDSAVRTALGDGLELFARSLLADAPLRARLNAWLQQVVVDTVEARRHEISGLIADTVRAWDPDTMAARVEHAAGDDLQYIRINGTLIGGLVGLVIHGGSHLLF